MEAGRTIRRSIAVAVILLVASFVVISNEDLYVPTPQAPPISTSAEESDAAMIALEKLPVKGRAPKTAYSREQFGDGWQRGNDGCDMRNIILRRDLKNTIVNTKCQVVAGTLADPYTGRTITFTRGETSSQDVQIDHVVALSNAWQTGAQLLSKEQRTALANDPLELLAVDGPANQQKGDGDAATWLPSQKPFRCQYIARQIAVKQKYDMWVTLAEKQAMQQILATCPGQLLPRGT